MRNDLDLTIGQRLGIGFGAAGALLVILLGTSHTLGDRIEAMRERNVGYVIPRAAAVEELETAVLYTGIAARSYVMTPSRNRLQAYEAAVKRASTALETLRQLEKEPDSEALFENIPALADKFSVAADVFVEDGRKQPAPVAIRDHEAALVAAREAVLEAVQRLSGLLQQKAVQTQTAIADAQRQANLYGPAIGGLLLLLLAWTAILTARGVRGPVLDLVSAARRLSAGDYEPALDLLAAHPLDHERRNELAELSRAFGTMALHLKTREARLQAKRNLSAAMAESIETRHVCEAGLAQIIAYLGVEVGAVYLAEAGACGIRLKRRFAHGLAGDEDLALGEGIPGRAAKSGRTVSVSEIPQDSPFTIRLGVDKLPPRSVAAVPMLLQDQLVGVIVIASLHAIDADAIDFLERAARQLAIGIQNALGHEKIRALAVELQQKNATLQVQYEEIQSQQEELQAQNEEIQAQNEELQAQTEELKSQGDTLRGTMDRLSESEARYHGLFTHLSEGFALHELVCQDDGRVIDCRILAANAAFEQAIGLRADALIGRTMREAMPDTDEATIERYAEVVRTGVPSRLDHRSGSDGRAYQVIVFRVNHRQFATLYMDLTDQKRAEQALLDADRHKNEFLAILSHELRNPLAPIKNSLYILSRAQPGSGQAQRAHQVIERQVGQLARLVEDLLDVTRISCGKVQLRRSDVDLCKVVHQAVEDNRTSFQENDIVLDVAIPEAAIPVNGDPVRLAQVVGNVLQNAVKFTPQRGSVFVRVERDRETARVRVRDTGAGMEPEMLDKIFQPFTQADAGLARTNGGLGLGLALVRSLVEMHDGTVRAASGGRGKGSEFIIELPLCSPVTPHERLKSPGSRVRRRVLLIEDNVDAAESLREALAQGGHQVEVASKGAEGIEKARTWHPDVLLCEIGLPDMDGHQIAGVFRNDPVLRSIVLVALTGHDDRLRASEAGFDAHVAKPPSIDRLEEILSVTSVRNVYGVPLARTDN